MNQDLYFTFGIIYGAISEYDIEIQHKVIDAVNDVLLNDKMPDLIGLYKLLGYNDPELLALNKLINIQVLHQHYGYDEKELLLRECIFCSNN